MKYIFVILILLIVGGAWCLNQAVRRARPRQPLSAFDHRPPACGGPGPAEQELRFDESGAIQDQPEGQVMDMFCKVTNPERTAIACDVHNGLQKWDITEMPFKVRPEAEDQQNLYRERVSIASLHTETVNIKLGLKAGTKKNSWLAGFVSAKELS